MYEYMTIDGYMYKKKKKTIESTFLQTHSMHIYFSTTS